MDEEYKKDVAIIMESISGLVGVAPDSLVEMMEALDNSDNNKSFMIEGEKFSSSELASVVILALSDALLDTLPRMVVYQESVEAIKSMTDSIMQVENDMYEELGEPIVSYEHAPLDEEDEEEDVDKNIVGRTKDGKVLTVDFTNK